MEGRQCKGILMGREVVELVGECSGVGWRWEEEDWRWRWRCRDENRLSWWITLRGRGERYTKSWLIVNSCKEWMGGVAEWGGWSDVGVEVKKMAGGAGLGRWLNDACAHPSHLHPSFSVRRTPQWAQRATLFARWRKREPPPSAGTPRLFQKPHKWALGGKKQMHFCPWVGGRNLCGWFLHIVCTICKTIWGVLWHCFGLHIMHLFWRAASREMAFGPKLLTWSERKCQTQLWRGKLKRRFAFYLCKYQLWLIPLRNPGCWWKSTQEWLVLAHNKQHACIMAHDSTMAHQPACMMLVAQNSIIVTQQTTTNSFQIPPHMQIMSCELCKKLFQRLKKRKVKDGTFCTIVEAGVFFFLVF